jgi:GGDEF domain-containing protein
MVTAKDLMPQDDPLKVLHIAVNCYLSTLQTVADSLAQACPAMGGPYRHRLSRLRTRLAFDANADALQESCSIVETEIKDYSRKTAAYVERHGVELRRGVGGLEEIVQTLSLRQDFYGSRLRQFAKQMESTVYPTDPEHLSEVVALQVAGLLSCVESMNQESQSLLARMRDEMTQVNQRMAEAEITDPVTGLMNRREMERRIAERTEREAPTLLLFELFRDLPDEIAQQVGARLASQFRYNDLICLWTAHQFLVMFQGTAETARWRSEQILPWIAGRYLLPNGATLEVTAEARLVSPEEIAEPDTVAASPHLVR